MLINGSEKVRAMEDNKLPLFIFPIGGRGDFLLSILYGNVLSQDWVKQTIDYATSDRLVDKIHYFGVSAYLNTSIQEDNLSEYLTIRISIDTMQDLLDVAYYNLTKRTLNFVCPTLHEGTISIPQWMKLNAVVSATETHINCFDGYKFDHVIPFAKLKDINYIKQLYTQFNQKELTLQELNRIEHNISLNQKILNDNPFVIADIFHMVPENSKLRRTGCRGSIKTHNINLRLIKEQIDTLFSVVSPIINNTDPVKLTVKNLEELADILQQIKGQVDG